MEGFFPPHLSPLLLRNKSEVLFIQHASCFFAQTLTAAAFSGSVVHKALLTEREVFTIISIETAREPVSTCDGINGTIDHNLSSSWIKLSKEL